MKLFKVLAMIIVAVALTGCQSYASGQYRGHHYGYSSYDHRPFVEIEVRYRSATHGYHNERYRSPRRYTRHCTPYECHRHYGPRFGHRKHRGFDRIPCERYDTHLNRHVPTPCYYD